MTTRRKPSRAPADFFASVNERFKQFFGGDNPNITARRAIQVAALAGPDYPVEIEVIAAKAP